MIQEAQQEILKIMKGLGEAAGLDGRIAAGDTVAKLAFALCALERERRCLKEQEKIDKPQNKHEEHVRCCECDLNGTDECGIITDGICLWNADGDKAESTQADNEPSKLDCANCVNNPWSCTYKDKGECNFQEMPF